MGPGVQRGGEVAAVAFLKRLAGDGPAPELRIGTGRIALSLAAQGIFVDGIDISLAGIRLNPVVQRYAWPSELDLRARIAGLRLRERWSAWSQEPFRSSSDAHISVYGR